MRVALSSVHCWPDVRRGGERYVHELGAALTRAGHDVTLLSTGRLPRHDTVLGVPVQRLPVRHLPRAGALDVELAFGAQALAHLGPRAVAGRFDVWHATSTSDAAAAALVARSGCVRSVFTDHGFPARRSRDARSDRRLHRFVARHVGEYVCVSQAAAAYLYSDYDRRAAVVPPGVRLADHRPAVREHRPTLLYVGSLSESRKGVPLLLEAAAVLRRSLPQLQVWLLGPGSPPEGVDPSLVTRCGLVDDEALRAAYAAAWVTVLPSVAESFGMVVVESLASGTPVVVRADSGGPAEIVTDTGVGVLAGPSSAELGSACAEALELAARADIGEQCRDVASRYDWDASIVPRLVEVYSR